MVVDVFDKAPEVIRCYSLLRSPFRVNRFCYLSVYEVSTSRGIDRAGTGERIEGGSAAAVLLVSNAAGFGVGDHGGAPCVVCADTVGSDYLWRDGSGEVDA